MSDKNRKSVALDLEAIEDNNAKVLATPTARDQDGHKLAKGAHTLNIIQ